MADEKVREVKGPGPRGQRGMPRPKIKNPGKLLKRLMGYVFTQSAWGPTEWLRIL